MGNSLVCPETGKEATLESTFYESDVIARYKYYCSECEWSIIVPQPQAEYHFNRHLSDPTGGLYPSQSVDSSQSSDSEKD